MTVFFFLFFFFWCREVLRGAPDTRLSVTHPPVIYTRTLFFFPFAIVFIAPRKSVGMITVMESCIYLFLHLLPQQKQHQSQADVDWSEEVQYGPEEGHRVPHRARPSQPHLRGRGRLPVQGRGPQQDGHWRLPGRAQ